MTGQTHLWIRLFSASLLWGLAGAGFSQLQAAEPAVNLDFGREVQPILARKCFACHGPDDETREADLRLDQRDAALDAGAIIPGDPQGSALVERIESADPDLKMPPPQAHEQLTETEKGILRNWIAQGATYKEHWAFLPLQRPEVPSISNEWAQSEIDAFALQKMQEHELNPAPAAEKTELIRRVCLDLTGLPPTPEQVDQFLADASENAYEKLVDQLLASPQYGEHWARYWLDLARYSDTNGYEKDRPRTIWPYRDWVIRAINEDLPYDQFSIEQLAGDLLPEPTIDQLIATGFHRNTMLNEEGGIDPLEYRFYAMVDRVATTGTVWMGMTIGCCQCHSHKYDPISHTDYYRLFALLNNADEPDQLLPDPAVTARREQLQSEVEQLDQSLLATLQERLAEKQAGATLPDRFAEWFQQEQSAAIDWQTVPILEATSNLPRLEVLEDGSVFSTGDITKRDQFQLTLDTSIFASPITAICLEVMPDDRLPARGPGRAFYEGRQGDFFLSELAATRDGKSLPFADGLVSYGKISIGSGSADAANVFDGDGSTGWSTSGKEGESHQLLLRFAEPVPAGQSINLSMLFERHFAASLGRFRILATTSTRALRVPRSGCDLEHQLATFTGKPEDARKQFEKQFLLQVPELNDLQEKRAKLLSQMPEFPTTLVMRERPADNPRPTYRHHRGEFLSPREEVTPAVPLLFPSLPEGVPADRLALARWLVSERNPLAARVAVNRYWQAIFGQGIVSSPGDFGTQSNIPTHPELLDWLASEFIAGNWSRKAILKTIVMSATYRQTSEVSAAVYQADPDNRWLARGPRIRLAAETIRDSLLAASGLLSSKMYGPGVYPPQPQSVTALAYGNVQWNPSTGEDRYRRSLYTFRKRTAPFAAMTTFDAPTGESCTVQRDRSNTPLQALTLLNDEMYLEMARALADLAIQQGEQQPEQILTIMFRRLLTRQPTAAELETLLAYWKQQQQELAEDPSRLKPLAGNGPETSERVSWILVARVLMNLDETIAKP